MASPPSPAGATSADSQAAGETLAWLSRMEILILDRQHQYIRRMLELQLESAMSEADRCPERVARARREARSALDGIRELLSALHESINQLPPQLRHAGRARAVVNTLGGNQGAALAVIDGLPAVKSPVAADCPICLVSLSSAPGDCSGADTADCDSHELDVVVDVVVLPCGGGAHKFHRQCIRQWMKLSARCPLCRQAVTDGRSSARLPRTGQQAISPLPSLPRPRSGPVAPISDVSPRSALDIDGEMDRLRSQSEGPRSGRHQARSWHDEGDPERQADDAIRYSQNRPRARVHSAVSGYGRAMAAAAVASAQRAATAAAADIQVRSVPLRVGEGIASGSLGDGAPTSSEARTSRAQANLLISQSAHHIVNSARSDASRSNSEPHGDDSARAHSSLRFRSMSEGPQGGMSAPSRLPPRSPLRLGGLMVAQAAGPSAGSTPVSQNVDAERHNVRSTRGIQSTGSSAAALATAASGYGRALASAAIASAQRRASAGPVMPPTPISQQRLANTSEQNNPDGH